MAGVSKLLQVDREVSKNRRAALKAQPAPAPAEPEAAAALPPLEIPTLAEAQAEPASPVTPDLHIPLPTPQPVPEPPASQESRRGVAPSPRRFRWTSWLVAFAIVAWVSLAAFDVWQRLQPVIRTEPPPVPQPVAQQPQAPAPVPPSVSPAADQPGRGTARDATANVLRLMERALRNAARAVETAQANARN